MITKSSPSAAWKIPVSGTVKIFHEFEEGHPERRRQIREEKEKFAIFSNKSLYLNNSER